MRPAFMKNPFALLCQPRYGRVFICESQAISDSAAILGRSLGVRASAAQRSLGTCAAQLPRRGALSEYSDRAKEHIMQRPLGMSWLVKLSRQAWQKTKIFSTIGLQMTLIATLVGCSSKAASDTPTPIPPVPAESVTAKEVADYAAAVLAIEPIRQEAYKAVQDNTKDEPVPDFTCTQTDTIAALSTDLEKVAVNYCNQAKKISEAQGFTMARFNEITVTAQSDAILQQRIQNELQRIQNEQQPSQQL